MENDAILSEIKDFCARTGIALSTFGLRAVRDGKLVRRLEAGGECLPSTATRIRQFIADPTSEFVPRRKRAPARAPEAAA